MERKLSFAEWLETGAIIFYTTSNIIFICCLINFQKNQKYLSLRWIFDYEYVYDM